MRTLSEMVIEVLKNDNSEKGMSAREIACIIGDKFPEIIEYKISNTIRKNKQEVIDQLVHEIYSNKNNILRRYENVSIDEERPILFFYKSGKKDSTDTKTKSKTAETDFSEHSLYKPIQIELSSLFNIYSMRIDEKKSGNAKVSNKWLHPDLVGIQDISEPWEPQVREMQSNGCDFVGGRFKLWSFEVKKEINGSNVRECYFQAVANSSWASFGYLVAQKFESSHKVNVKDELQLLASSFGIGVMSYIKHENVSEDLEIIIPATEKPIQWDSINKLTINKDFNRYIENINKAVKIGKINENDWN